MDLATPYRTTKLDWIRVFSSGETTYIHVIYDSEVCVPRATERLREDVHRKKKQRISIVSVSKFYGPDYV